MSQNHFNYMSGVPVKIAESYKPPKKLALTQSVSQRLSTSSNVTTQLLEKNTYEFALERNVLGKMCEWQHMRQRENCDRKERMQQHQQELKSQFDAKQKQMLTAVSYPSTDDLSSDDDGDDSGHGTSSDASKSAVSSKTVPVPCAQPKGPQQQFSPPNMNNILVPTVMPGQKNTQIKHSINSIKTSHSSKFSFHEFENDTSSPFDNVELKTMNDLDILAEVWNSSVAIKNTSSNSNTPTNDESSTKESNVNHIEHNPIANQTYANQTVNSNSYHHAMTNAQHNQTNSNQMNHSKTTTSTNSTIPITSSYYVNQLHYNHHIDSNQSYPIANHTYINNNPTYSIAQNPYTVSNYISPIYNDRTATITMPNHTNPIATGPTTSMYADKTVITTSSIQTKSKWKSVPDIVQEINTEIQNSQGRRTRNISQSKTIILIF